MTVSEKLVEKLLKLDLFSSLTPEFLKNILSCDETFLVDYKRGDVIYSAEHFRFAIGFVVRGGAKVLKSENGVIISKLTDGSLFGCAALFSGRDYFVNEIVATKDTRVFYIDKSVIVKIMQLDTTFSVSYIRYLSERILFLNKRIVNFTGGTAESRLANYLLSCFADYKTYELDRSMSQLAVSLDIGRASLYRAFDALELGNAVQRDGKYIRLIDKEALKGFIQ